MLNLESRRKRRDVASINSKKNSQLMVVGSTLNSFFKQGIRHQRQIKEEAGTEQVNLIELLKKKLRYSIISKELSRINGRHLH